MSIRTKCAAVFVFLIMVLGVPTVYAADMNEDFAFKISLENHLERRLKHIITEITGSDRGVVIVNADIGAVKDSSNRGTIKKKKSTDALILPGVPVKKEYGTGLSESAELLFPGAGGGKYKVNKISLAIWLDSGVSESVVNLIGDLAKQVIGFTEDRGDVINIQQINFSTEKFYWSSIIYPKNLFLIVLAVIGAFFLFTATIFLKDPFKRLSPALNNLDWEHIRGTDGDNEGMRGGFGAQDLLATAAVETAQERVEGAEDLPFAYIDERDVASLTFILNTRSAEDIAIVANYLDPHVASRLLESLPAEKQAEVMVFLSNEKVDPAKVQNLEKSVREQLSYVVGGERKLVSILRMASDEVRERVMKSLEGSNKDAAARLKSRVKGFEQMITDMPAQGIQLLYRQFNPMLFAQILKSSAEPVRKKVLGSLSAGAAERLEQEIELSPALSTKRLRREKLNLMLIVNRLMDEGILEGIEG